MTAIDTVQLSLVTGAAGATTSFSQRVANWNARYHAWEKLTAGKSAQQLLRLPGPPMAFPAW